MRQSVESVRSGHQSSVLRSKLPKLINRRFFDFLSRCLLSLSPLASLYSLEPSWNLPFAKFLTPPVWSVFLHALPDLCIYSNSCDHAVHILLALLIKQMIQITRLPTKCFDYPHSLLVTQFSFQERFRPCTFSTRNEVPDPQGFRLGRGGTTVILIR